MRPVAAVILALVCGLWSACGVQAGDAERAAEEFYAAVAAKDGVRACDGLTSGSAKQLEKDQRAPCAEAVVKLKLEGSRPAASEIYVTGARVRFERGDSVFLDETQDGWKVSAAGCKPQRGEEAPFDCEVES